MSRAAVLASGRGSNFEAIFHHLAASRHEVSFLASDRPGSGALRHAEALGVPGYLLSYAGRGHGSPTAPHEAELRLLELVSEYRIDLVVLAGFMRILTGSFLSRARRPVVNVHPSLLPKYPGADALRRSFEAGDAALGITIHLVDAGVDTGPILTQASFPRRPEMTLAEAEERIHLLEHRAFPRVVEHLLDASEEGRQL